MATITASYAAKRLFTSFKKAAWIASTTILILMVPLIIEMDREQQVRTRLFVRAPGLTTARG